MPSTNSHFSAYTADQIKRNTRELYPETTITNLGGTRTNQTPYGIQWRLHTSSAAIYRYRSTDNLVLCFSTNHAFDPRYSLIFGIIFSNIRLNCFSCLWLFMENGSQVWTQRYPQHRFCMISNGYIIGNLFKWANIFSDENLKNCSLSIY